MISVEEKWTLPVDAVCGVVEDELFIDSPNGRLYSVRAESEYGPFSVSVVADDWGNVVELKDRVEEGSTVCVPMKVDGRGTFSQNHYARLDYSLLSLE